MIRLHKGSPPAILTEKAAEWTTEYLQALATGGEIKKSVRFRYRHPDIKAAIRLESHNKCIYCESPIGFGQTDHLIPVSRFPALVVDWNNLALVCPECNTHKSDYYDPAMPLINPYLEDPEGFLLFLGPFVMAVAGNPRGQVTERQLKLNRPDLFERRTRRLMMLQPLLHQWASQPPGTLKDLLRTAILEEAKDDKDTQRQCGPASRRRRWRNRRGLSCWGKSSVTSPLPRKITMSETFHLLRNGSNFAASSLANSQFRE